MSKATIIEKEEIKNLHFDNREVLSDKEAIAKRKEALESAMVMGNNYKGKVLLTFESAEGTHSVETTIWATTDHDVTLKGGIVIPISSISEVYMW